MDTDFDPRKLTVEQLLQVRDLLIELRMLRAAGVGVGARPRKPIEWWAALDWTKSNTALAREHKLNVTTVGNWRLSLGHANPTQRDAEHRPPLQKAAENEVDYSHLDFANKSDATLAKEVGVTREYMRQVRAKLGLPRRTHWQLKFEKFKEHFKDRKMLSFQQCLDEGCTCRAESTFEDYCVRQGIEIIAPMQEVRRWPWHLIDFRLSNKVLAEIWDANPGVFSNWRSSHGKPAAALRAYKVVPPEFLPLIEKQKRVAAEWKASQEKPGTDSTAAPG